MVRQIETDMEHWDDDGNLYCDDNVVAWIQVDDVRWVFRQPWLKHTPEPT